MRSTLQSRRRTRTARQRSPMSTGAEYGARQRRSRRPVDTGGTFTDLVLLAGWRRSRRSRSRPRPRDPSQAVLDGIRRLLPEGDARSCSCTARRWRPTRSWSAAAPVWSWSPTRASRTSSRSGGRTGRNSTRWSGTDRPPLVAREDRIGVAGPPGTARRGDRSRSTRASSQALADAGRGARRRVRGRLAPARLRQPRATSAPSPTRSPSSGSPSRSPASSCPSSGSTSARPPRS